MSYLLSYSTLGPKHFRSSTYLNQNFKKNWLPIVWSKFSIIKGILASNLLPNIFVDMCSISSFSKQQKKYPQKSGNHVCKDESWLKQSKDAGGVGAGGACTPPTFWDIS